MSEPRAWHGDAPRWVLLPVLVTWLGIPVAVLAYALVGTAAGWNDAPSPAPVVSAVVVVVLLWLTSGAVRRRPLIAVDRNYYRFALFFIGLMGFLGTWRIGAVLAALLLVHSLYADRVAKQSPGHHPATKG